MLKKAILLGGIALAAASGAPAAEVVPRLDSFLSYTFVGELKAPERGDRIGWMELHKGVRSIWLARAPDYRPVELASTHTDDGQDLSELAFSPDGRVFAWVRGAVEHNGWAAGLPAANPANGVTKPEMEIWASTDGGAPVKVGEGEEPSVSSKGAIAFIRDNQVWTVKSDGSAKPEKLFYDRGKVDQLEWSPDGTRLAFVSHRGDHSFIGIYSGPERPITWLAPVTAFDDSPVWSPDGSKIAFIRRNGIPDILTSPRLKVPNPFSIWVASAQDGSAGLVWQSPRTDRGSYPAVPDGLFLMWGAGDRLTFRAEMDGWAHLYSVPATGGTPLLLTPGDYMVEHVTMAPDRRTLLFSANVGGTPGDIDRRHVLKVDVERPGPIALTSGIGQEWQPAALGARIAYISSTPQVPPRVAIADESARNPQLLTASDPDFPSASLVIPQSVTFKARDGLLIHGQLFLPRDGAPSHPGIIFVHGGPPRQMLLGWSYMDYYTHSYAMNQYLASRGYVVLSVNYRLGIGYGRDFQHPDKAGATGNSEYQDVVAGAHFLQSLPEVDRSRIGIWGGSYGGLLTAQALARDSNLFKAGVDLHGVHDWSIGRSAPQRYEQEDFDELRRISFISSPMAALKTWRSPVLLVQGDDDRNVKFEQTVDLARRLEAQGTPFEELIIPNEVHGFLRYDTWLRVDSAAVRFLDTHLKQ